jgi:hypothetical protein
MLGAVTNIPSATCSLIANRNAPLVVTPVGAGDMDALCAILRESKEQVLALLHRHGALLFRGFGVLGAFELERAAESFSPNDWVQYREAATPRDAVAGHVSTSTKYASSEIIYQHNENSHVTTWPQYLHLSCSEAPASEGATTLCDCRAVLKRVPIALRTRLEAGGVLYRRALPTRHGLGFNWREAFGVRTEDELERYCNSNFMKLIWVGNESVVVLYRRWAVLDHPLTGDCVWFNHGTFFNARGLTAAQRALVADVGIEFAPYHTFFGDDGGILSHAEFSALRAAYDQETYSYPWRPGDYLLLDNMLMAHGRQSFTGTRTVLVTMTGAVSCTTAAKSASYEVPIFVPDPTKALD